MDAIEVIIVAVGCFATGAFAGIILMVDVTGWQQRCKREWELREGEDNNGKD